MIEELNERSFEGVDIALFSAGGGISRKFAPIAVKAGAVVVDNSSAFRMDPNVPLVIPEINAHRIRDHKGIIANPNCAAITALVPLWPIHQQQPHQARDPVDLSGGERRRRRGDGRAGGIDARQPQRAGLCRPRCCRTPTPSICSTTTPLIDPETGYNDEETKVIKETRKIFEDDRIAVGVTCVRVPVLRAHCEAITFECEKPITEDEVRAILSRAPGVKIVDDRAKNYFPMPIDASGQDDVLVGRIRKDLSDPSGHSISMFVAADQLLKGAALNAIQIAELLPQRVMA